MYKDLKIYKKRNIQVWELIFLSTISLSLFLDGNDWPGRSVMFGAKADWSCYSNGRLIIITAGTVALVSLFGQHIVLRRIFWLLLNDFKQTNIDLFDGWKKINNNSDKIGRYMVIYDNIVDNHSCDGHINGETSGNIQNIIAFFTLITLLIIFLLLIHRLNAPTIDRHDKLQNNTTQKTTTTMTQLNWSINFDRTLIFT